MPIEDVEKLERYRLGGYHPVTVGEQLGGRYSIVHKLGFGSSSTIRLARNQKAGKYVAIKIPVAARDSTETRETDILRRLYNTGLEEKTHPGAAYIPSILDGFSLSGPNGVHHCYVTEPGMMSLAEAKDASSIRFFQLPVARAMAAQLVQAVKFLHSQGIVHGDLHDGKVLVRLPGSMDYLSPEQLYEKYGSPQYEAVVRLDQCRLPVGVSENIILTDFGESFMPATIARPYSNAPEVLTPPEVYFEQRKSLSFPADIWTPACTIWAIIAQRPLFEGYSPSADWVIKEQVDCLGKLHAPWWLKWNARARWFNEDWERKIEAHSRPLEQRFNDSVRQPRQEFRMDELDEIEKVALLSMLKAMLAFDPEERPTAQEVLNCEWIQKWALPELSQVHGD
ncbi:kinase-like domain-containing protein [Penicillium concentricum]|uniref:non-specific serine/threonine protein kinase n=1 Tax=Penicillium concentricum TaxID=293559 RepID=A0A9W9VD44_9EURO|nr:kinase-like domain-containing protein [Penicillium concentricum]KAJ5375026.1 kinase-like domain-containing protein [Penicillium concentricum]